MTGLTIEELAVGDQATMSRTITSETVREFVDATGDDNPLHSDARFAATTRFGQVIAPGILTGGLLSAVIGTRLPGPGTIYLTQSFRFLKPVHIGDTLTARVAVVEIERERGRVRLATVVTNQAGADVLDGEAAVIPPKVHVQYQAPPARVDSVGAGSSASRATATAGRPDAWTPAALAVQLVSFWVASGCAFAGEALRFFPGPPAPIRRA